MAAYVPDRGDAIWLEFLAPWGKGQTGRQPALVLSTAAYNRKSGLAVVCPITSHSQGYPFESPIPPGLPVTGVVLGDQVRSLDWHERRARRIGRMPDLLVGDVTAKLAALLNVSAPN